jgi:elongation factor Tu
VLDTHVPAPVRRVDRPFLMPVEGVHVIEGRGTVATGLIEQGTVAVGQKVEVVGLGGLVETVVTSIEAFNRPQATAEAGMNVGLLLRGVKADQVERGQVVAAPRTVKPRSRFAAEVYVLAKEEGGRHTPFFDGYRPQFFFKTADVTGRVALAAGAEMVMPGDHARVEVGLDKPVAVEAGSRFALREGGRTVGSGVVTEVME